MNENSTTHDLQHNQNKTIQHTTEKCIGWNYTFTRTSIYFHTIVCMRVESKLTATTRLNYILKHQRSLSIACNSNRSILILSNIRIYCTAQCAVNLMNLFLFLFLSISLTLSRAGWCLFLSMKNEVSNWIEFKIKWLERNQLVSHDFVVS